MKKNENKGLLNLAKKTIAVISGSISALTGTQAHAVETPVAPTPDQANLEVSFKKELKPQFTLRLNSSPEKSMLFLHKSHSSHSSHRSHSSHASHYSSSSTYSLPPPPPRAAEPAATTYTPSTSSSSPSTTSRATSSAPTRSSVIRSTIKSKGTYTGTNTVSKSTLEVLNYYYRELYKGCEGSDVEYIQHLLVAAGYTTPTTGYFGDKTEAAVLKFQKENELKPDGRVKEKTLIVIRDKVDGI